MTGRRMTVARPNITVSAVEELFADRLGQLWSPATITLTWPAAAGLHAPSVHVNIIAHSHPAMTAEQLTQEQLRAAHDVLTAALLGLEISLETEFAAGSPQKGDRATDKKPST